jgi:hypothetical protein
MNAIYLHLPDGTPTKWSMCTECKQVAAPGNYDLSVKCCTCYDCGLPLAKDERIPWVEGKGKALYHRKCQEERQRKRESERLEKAELLTDYDGPIYCDGWRGSFGDGYFADVQELAETLDDDEDQSARPDFAFCCDSRQYSLDIDSALENSTEEMYDDASDDLDGVEELRAAVGAFNKLNENVRTYDVDYKHKVSVPPVQMSAEASE